MKKIHLFMSIASLGLLTTLLATPVNGQAQPIPAGLLAAVLASYLGSEVTISANNNEQYAPSVAYNWKHHEYLVVWHDAWTLVTRDIRAARVSEQGQVLSEFIVYEITTRDSAQPSVDYDPVNDRYLVAWIFDAFGNSSDWDLYGRFIPWNGPSPSLTAFPISTWSTHQVLPKVAYGRAVEEFLVVWENIYQNGTLPIYISGRRVKADGSGFPGSDSDLTINHASQFRENPDVTYNLARNEYLVVYDNDADIFGIRLTGNLSNNFGGEFGIASWPAHEIYPAVAACKGADQYLVAWQSDQSSANFAIYARFIGGDGVLAGVHLIEDTTGPEQEPDVTCNQAGNQYLVAWQTMPTNSTFGIWGRLLQPDQSMNANFSIVHPGL